MNRTTRSMFELALLCGFPHPDIMVEQTGLTAEQLEETLAYLDLFPKGEKRMDMRFTILCSIVSAAFGGKKVEVDFDAPVFKPARSKAEAGEALAKRLCRNLGIDYGRIH